MRLQPKTIAVDVGGVQVGGGSTNYTGGGESGGCDCQGAESSHPLPWLAALMLGVWGLRRRRPSA